MTDAEPLIYSPAVRRNIGLLLMFAGPSGSGKTLSALRVAVGLANGGPIAVCDTEHGRALYYASLEGEAAQPPETFAFDHLALKEPFEPKRFEQALVTATNRKAAVWICDSFSHEHVGPGGMLDMHEANLQRMTKGDHGKRDALKYTAWIEPKQDHKHLVQRLWQVNMHVILCCHAEVKFELVQNDKGKWVPNPERYNTPVCAVDLPYAMTASFMFDAKNPGVPQWQKYFGKIAPLIDLQNPMDEATGARLAAWAQGQKGQTQRAPMGRTEQALKDLIDRFNAATHRSDYLAIIDTETDRDRIKWFKDNRSEMHQELRTVMEAAYARTEEKIDQPA